MLEIKIKKPPKKMKFKKKTNWIESIFHNKETKQIEVKLKEDAPLDAFGLVHLEDPSGNKYYPDKSGVFSELPKGVILTVVIK